MSTLARPAGALGGARAAALLRSLASVPATFARVQRAAALAERCVHADAARREVLLAELHALICNSRARRGPR